MLRTVVLFHAPACCQEGGTRDDQFCTLLTGLMGSGGPGSGNLVLSMANILRHHYARARMREDLPEHHFRFLK